MDCDECPPRRGASRRRLLALAPAAAVVAGVAACDGSRSGSSGGNATPSPSTTVSPAPATGALAANVNQNLDHLDPDRLAAAAATWVRGFLTVTAGERSGLESDPGLAHLLTLAKRGYGTVLSLKFQFRHEPLPAPGSPAMRDVLARLDTVLAATMGRVDILVVGNEPFFETRPVDRAAPRINRFYEALARRAITYRRRHGATRTQLYLGALTSLDDPTARTPQTRRFLTFAHRTEGIAGVDIHPHVAAADDVRRYLDYVLPALRADQRFLVTEFSLILLWKQHLRDPVDAGFANRHGLATGAPMWRAIAEAIRRPVDERAWTDLLLSNRWFADNRGFLGDQLARFRDTGKLAVAAYGVSQGPAMTRHFGPDSHPWLLNSLYCPETCQPQPNGLPGRNLTWYREFRAAQRH